jgi:phosphatidylglycerophosphate synthase
VADWLVRRRATPNAISIAGAIAACLAGACFALTRQAPDMACPLWLLGAVLVQARLMANLLDGMVAIGRGIASATGELFNEVPDRVSDTAVLIGLGWAAGQPALGFAAALMAMATAYVRAVGKGMGQASDFSGPMAKQQRMALVTVLAVACGVLPTAWVAVWPAIALWIVTLGALLTAGRRLAQVARALRP